MAQLLNPSAPSRDESRKAAAIFDSMYDQCQSANDALAAAQEEISTLKTRLHTALNQVDVNERRVFMLEQAEHMHIIEREAFVTMADMIFDAASKLKEHVAMVLLKELDRKNGQDKKNDLVAKLEADILAIARRNGPKDSLVETIRDATTIDDPNTELYRDESERS